MELFEKRKSRPGINLTPLIDILFILIIFFVVSSKIASDSGVEMRLPESKQSHSTMSSKLILSMDRTGVIRLNDSVILLEELPQVLSELQKKNSIKTLILNIDQTMKHGSVIQLMDIAKKSGVQKIVFGTRPAQN